MFQRPISYKDKLSRLALFLPVHEGGKADVGVRLLDHGDQQGRSQVRHALFIQYCFKIYVFIGCVKSSVADQSHFDVDPNPNPENHIWEEWIRILGSTYPE